MDLIEWAEARFDGPDLEDHDHLRLGAQAAAVYRLMSDGRWRTLREIAAAVDAPEASVSARLRDFRKARFNSHDVQRRRRFEGKGVWEYRLVIQ